MKLFKLIKGLFNLVITIIIIAGLMTILYPIRYVDKISFYSEAYQVDPYLIVSVIKVESGFREDARSSKGAIGLMQVMEDTGYWIYQKLYNREAKDLNLYDVDVNLEFGIWFLSYLLDKYDGNQILAIAAYNAGASTVENWLNDEAVFKNKVDYKDIPYPETREYVKNVNKSVKVYKFLYNGFEGEHNLWIRYLELVSSFMLFLKTKLFVNGSLRATVSDLLDVVKSVLN